jgi:O-antigen ligase
MLKSRDIRTKISRAPIGSAEESCTKIAGLFTQVQDVPYKIMLFLVVFGAFRPDRLLPGGKALMYLPTLLLLVLMLFLVRKPKKNFNNKQTKLFLCYFALIALWVPFSRNTGLSRRVFQMFLTGTVPWFLSVIHFMDSPYKIEKLIRWSVGLSLFQAVLGLIGGGLVHLPSLQDENDFGLFVNCMLPFTFFLAQEAETSRRRLFYYAASAIFALANVASFSRGGFVGLCAVGAFCLFNAPNKARNFLILTIVVLILAFSAPKTYWAEIETIGPSAMHEDTGQARMDYWKAGWKMFLAHPLFGVGPMNYSVWVEDYHENRARMWGRVAHSLYFTLLPEMGLVGIFLFFSMLYVSIKDHKHIYNLYNRRNALLALINLPHAERAQASRIIRFYYFLSLALSGSAVGYLVTGAFISVLWYGYFYGLVAQWVMVSNSAKQIESLLVNASSHSAADQANVKPSVNDRV